MVLSDIANLGRYSKSLIVVKCDKCLCEKEIKYKLYIPKTNKALATNIII